MVPVISLHQMVPEPLAYLEQKDGLLISEVDLNHCRQVQRYLGISNDTSLEEYAKALDKAAQPDFEPQIIRDTGK